MSYCRFSTDDYQCDVYVYEAEDGFTTHVAANRIIFTEQMPPYVSLGDNVEAWHARHLVVMEAVSRAERKNIGLPHDGACFVDSTAEDCAARLDSLKAMGYNVPKNAIDALMSEAIAETEKSP